MTSGVRCWVPVTLGWRYGGRVVVGGSGGEVSVNLLEDLDSLFCLRKSAAVNVAK